MSIPGCLEFSDTYELRVGGTLVEVPVVIVSYSNYYMEQGDDCDNRRPDDVKLLLLNDCRSI